MVDIRKRLGQIEFCCVLTIKSSLRPLLSTSHVAIPVAMTWKNTADNKSWIHNHYIYIKHDMQPRLCYATWTAPSPTVAALLDEIPVKIQKLDTISGAIQIREALQLSSEKQFSLQVWTVQPTKKGIYTKVDQN